jgi:hypothetical protein
MLTGWAESAAEVWADLLYVIHTLPPDWHPLVHSRSTVETTLLQEIPPVCSQGQPNRPVLGCWRHNHLPPPIGSGGITVVTGLTGSVLLLAVIDDKGAV